jgi:hypothetical protein
VQQNIVDSSHSIQDQLLFLREDDCRAGATAYILVVRRSFFLEAAKFAARMKIGASASPRAGIWVSTSPLIMLLQLHVEYKAWLEDAGG